MTRKLTRRELIGYLTGFGGALGVTLGGGFALSSPDLPEITTPTTPLPDFAASLDETTKRTLSIAHGKGTPAGELVEAAVDGLGGMSRFVVKGDRVLIKPNAAWSRAPHLAATTHPDLVARLVSMAYAAGAKEVLVADHTCHKPATAYADSGIAEAVAAAKGTMVTITEGSFSPVSAPGEILDGWPFLSLFQDVDKVINAAVVKHHSLSKVTISLKNLMGCIGGDRGLMHQDIHRYIATLGKMIKCTLHVADATRVLVRNGPVGGNPGDVEIHDTVGASVDPVALDSWASTFVVDESEELRFLTLAKRYKVGDPDWKSLTVVDKEV